MAVRHSLLGSFLCLVALSIMGCDDFSLNCHRTLSCDPGFPLEAQILCDDPKAKECPHAKDDPLYCADKTNPVVSCGDSTTCDPCFGGMEFPHGEAACSPSGECTIQCDAGRNNCNGFSEDGCETDLMSDKDNCGDCDNACPTGTMCTMGKCI